MAEIKVEPKRGGLGWLWAIIVLALIAAAVWYFMNNSRAVPATTPRRPTRLGRRLRRRRRRRHSSRGSEQWLTAKRIEGESRHARRSRRWPEPARLLAASFRLKELDTTRSSKASQTFAAGASSRRQVASSATSKTCSSTPTR